MRLLRKLLKSDAQNLQQSAPFSAPTFTAKPPETGHLRTLDQLSTMLRLSTGDIATGRYRLGLYRFLVDHIPAVNACVWTWARLATADGNWEIVDAAGDRSNRRALERLERLDSRLGRSALGRRVGLPSLLSELFAGLFRDGIAAGILTVTPDGSAVDSLVPIDSAGIAAKQTADGYRLKWEPDDGRSLDLDAPDVFLLTYNAGPNAPLGRSILQAVPFVSYIEQQLVDDMRRATHNSGYHRLHVKVTPPERMAGEADTAYVKRSNSYFDATVDMIKSCDVEDNPVTWDNVAIDYIGPQERSGVTNSWFYNHRAMIEEICAGTNLSPFLLGYSYGATTSWSGFKFDLVMRQVRAVQAEMSQLLEWIGNVELALAGIDARCRYRFDNSLSYRATDQANVTATRAETILKLFTAGLIDQETARVKASCLI